MKTIFINTENSKTNELYKFVFKLLQRLDLSNSNIQVAFQNLSIHYTRGKISENIIKTINLN